MLVGPWSRSWPHFKRLLVTISLNRQEQTCMQWSAKIKHVCHGLKGLWSSKHIEIFQDSHGSVRVIPCFKLLCIKKLPASIVTGEIFLSIKLFSHMWSTQSVTHVQWHLLYWIGKLANFVLKVLKVNLIQQDWTERLYQPFASKLSKTYTLGDEKSQPRPHSIAAAYLYCFSMRLTFF